MTSFFSLTCTYSSMGCSTELEDKGNVSFFQLYVVYYSCVVLVHYYRHKIFLSFKFLLLLLWFAGQSVIWKCSKLHLSLSALSGSLSVTAWRTVIGDELADLLIGHKVIFCTIQFWQNIFTKRYDCFTATLKDWIYM